MHFETIICLQFPKILLTSSSCLAKSSFFWSSSFLFRMSVALAVICWKRVLTHKNRMKQLEVSRIMRTKSWKNFNICGFKLQLPGMLNGHFGTSKTQSTVLYYRIKKKTKHTKSSNEILLQNSRYDDQAVDLFSWNYSSWECKFQAKMTI